MRRAGGGGAEQTLQKLIYVSGLAFGEQKAAFLLPWSRVFNMTDAQLYVAKRDNARALFKQHLDQLGGTLPVTPPWPPPLSITSQRGEWTTGRRMRGREIELTDGWVSRLRLTRGLPRKEARVCVHVRCGGTLHVLRFTTKHVLVGPLRARCRSQ